MLHFLDLVERVVDTLKLGANGGAGSGNLGLGVDGSIGTVASGSGFEPPKVPSGNNAPPGGVDSPRHPPGPPFIPRPDIPTPKRPRRDF